MSPVLPNKVGKLRNLNKRIVIHWCEKQKFWVYKIFFRLELIFWKFSILIFYFYFVVCSWYFACRMGPQRNRVGWKRDAWIDGMPSKVWQIETIEGCTNCRLFTYDYPNGRINWNFDWIGSRSKCIFL